MLDRAVSKVKIQRDVDNKKFEKEGGKGVGDKNKGKNRKDPGIPLKTGERIVYCADYNKGRCERDNSHDGKFLGKEVFKHHVCRVCLTVDKEKRAHTESDEKCPNKSA